MTDQNQYIEYTADDYTDAIANELPRGSLWNRDPNSSLMKWVAGCAETWADVSKSNTRLLFVEGDPNYCDEMLPDWEACFGLPDPCVKVPLTLAQRRAALLNKVILSGCADDLPSRSRASRQFFINLAASLGYTITITEYIPFVFGLSSFGIIGNNNEIMRPDARYYWTVNIQGESQTRFEFGYSMFGTDSFLELNTAADLVCCINRWKPAHTVVIFNYVQD